MDVNVNAYTLKGELEKQPKFNVRERKAPSQVQSRMISAKRARMPVSVDYSAKDDVRQLGSKTTSLNSRHDLVQSIITGKYRVSTQVRESAPNFNKTSFM